MYASGDRLRRNCFSEPSAEIISGGKRNCGFTSWTYGSIHRVFFLYKKVISAAADSLCKNADGTWVGFGSNNDGALGISYDDDKYRYETPTTLRAYEFDPVTFGDSGKGQLRRWGLCVAGSAHSLCREADGSWQQP
jgi:hypothetical protein